MCVPELGRSISRAHTGRVSAPGALCHVLCEPRVVLASEGDRLLEGLPAFWCRTEVRIAIEASEASAVRRNSLAARAPIHPGSTPALWQLICAKQH